MNRISARQFGAIALSAVFGPALIVGGSLDWSGALIGAAAAALLWCVFLWKTPPALAEKMAQAQGGKMLLVLYLLWCIFFLGWLIQLCDAAFPEVTAFPVVPGVLLGLAWWASSGGSARLGRVAGILAVALLVMFAVPLLAGSFEADWRSIRPARDDIWRGAALLLTPALLLFEIETARERPKPYWLLPAVVALGLTAAVCRGILGNLDRATNNALYEATKSISLGGVMERFESLVSSALAASLFVGMAVTFSAMDKIQKKVLKTPSWAVRLSACILAAGVWWMPLAVSGGIAQLGSLLFCGLLPIVLIFAETAGNPKKDA